MASSDPLKEFETLLAGSDYLFVLYYRGHWCPFCTAHIRELIPLAPAFASANATPVIITAEDAKQLPTTRAATGYTGAAIVDPAHIIATELRRRGWVDVAIQSCIRYYPHNRAEPAVLVVKRDGTVLESWAIAPALSNLYGGTSRPRLEQIWKNALAKEKGEARPHKKYNTTTVMVFLRQKLFG
ncbi:hypothetical protein AJ80_07517 [Polytolypa hystricis UAMH7299]|uniref:Thioredoxin domain-containing protein n=1 Tax=Polytolypa hystricis (strain UAMH7299) TaxID=1447883 RepID=A0A2B7XFL5_POLH7|nr:hypothetical protein AJ80_07517 [Polytolypa hystricis UAMH7299]